MKKKQRRILGYAALIVGAVVGAGIVLAAPSSNPPEQLHGVTFSAPHAEGIGLDWQEAFDALLEDLGVRRFRLMAFWEQIEPVEGEFDFTDLDYQMDQVAEHGGEVILAIGRKVPRWPECHIPVWARELPEDEQQQKVLAMLPVVIERYNEHPALRMWQLENEPLLDFGICPPEDLVFFEQEQEVVRSLSDVPILITDSGELNSWVPAAKYGDILGTTMYRTVFSGRTQEVFSYDYIFPAWAYRLKARAVQAIRGKDVLISELQGEPWGAKPFHEMTNEQRAESLTVERLVDLADFARRTQLPETYWWGAEYWYWEKDINDNDAFWDTARDFFD